MAIYEEYDPATGKIYEVWEPDSGAAPTLTPWDQEMMTHPPQRRTMAERVQDSAAEQLGVPLADVDLSAGNMGPGARALFGFGTDTTDEEKAYLQMRYPGSEIVDANGTLVLRTPDGQILTPNPPGFEPLGSPAQFAGRAGPGIAAGTLGAIAGAGGGPPGAFAGAAGGVAAVEAAREGAQRLVGTARESFADVTKRIAVDMALEGIPLAGKGAKTLIGKVFGRGRTEAATYADKLSPEELNAFIQWARENDVTVPNLKRAQQIRAGGPLDRAVDQMLQFNPEARGRLIDQMDQFARGIRDAGPAVAFGRSPDELLQEGAAANYRRKFQTYAGESVDTEVEGKNVAEAVETTRTKRKASMNEGYDRLRTLTDEWKPRYDISNARDAARRRQVNGDLLMPRVADGELQRPPKGEPGLTPAGDTVEYETLGPVEVREYMGRIKVNPDPAGKLAQINDLLARLDPRQDYATVQELRSQVGRLLEMPRARLLEGGVDIGQAKRIYGDLVETLEDPQDVIPGARTGIINATQEANRRAVDYYNMYDQPAVERALEAPRTGEMPALFLSVADDPKVLNEQFRRVLDEGTVEQQARFRQALEGRLLQNGDPVDNLARLWRDNRAAYEWLFPTEAARRIAKGNARILRDLNNGISKEAEDAAFEEVGFAMKVIQDHMGKRTIPGTEGVAQARDLVGQYGGVNSEGHRALRQGIWADLMSGNRGALEFHEATDNLVLNPKRLRDRIADLKKSGLWLGVLTDRDRRVLEGALSYAKATYRKGSAGTGLTVAAQVGQARHGDIGAIGSIYSGYKMADWLTRDAIDPSALWQRVGGQTGRRSWLGDPRFKRTLGTIARGYGQGVAADQAREDSRSPTPRPPANLGLPPPLTATPPG